MKLSLVKKLTLGFLIAILGAILITSLVSNYMIDRRFNEYLHGEHQRKIDKVIELVNTIYDEKNGFQNKNDGELERVAVLEDLYIRVLDDQGSQVFSSGQDHLLHKKMMYAMPGRMMGMGWRKQLGEYIEESYPLKNNAKKIGTVIIGYFGQWNLTERDIGFKSTLNQAFGISATAALLFGVIVSIWFSRQITTPLVRITQTARIMGEGNLNVRANVNTNTLELDQLSKAMNYLAESLQQQEMLRKRLTTDMAHEIRTPLTTLKSHIEAFLDGIWTPTEDRFASCYEEVERLSKLVGNLQNLAKLEQANLQLNREEFSLSEEIQKMVEAMRPQFIKKNIEVSMKLDGDKNVFMDRDKVRQILINLLTNAYKYTNEGGFVRVELEERQEEIVIEIGDTGIGVGEKDLPHIFERFYRGDISRSRETGGTGIGLAITKALVEAHGGKIKVKSKIDVGTTFIMNFPKTAIELRG
ncbi:signal transduction histidine kinase [Anaerosolibacter carboniphilus]|uniref:histidine kinase n=1 Tax=Anaerosolibacter carboniphilus TaxID=1417629 RepID=A0A841KUT6_9FIRM|nr:HAMP domain-containing sensor histidine kinase [Anaerosolibacter carboniphilus]MBB6217133.1 signal transduction histidine kinase [Anaerosolibacter carboniphilus]